VDTASRDERYRLIADDARLNKPLRSRPAGELGQAPILGLAAGMAFLAGATDVYGLAELHDLYVSFMSGNTTMLGVALGTGDPTRAATIAVLIGLFVIGAAGGAVLANVFGRFQTPAVLSVVSTVLCVPLLMPGWTVYAFILAMGSLNAATTKVGAANVSLTFVTGALVRFGQGLGNWVTGRRADLSWLVQAAMWGSLLTGSCAAAFVRHLGVGRPWPLPLIAVLLAAAGFILRPDAAAPWRRQREAAAPVPWSSAASSVSVSLGLRRGARSRPP